MKLKLDYFNLVVIHTRAMTGLFWLAENNKLIINCRIVSSVVCFKLQIPKIPIEIKLYCDMQWNLLSVLGKLQQLKSVKNEHSNSPDQANQRYSPWQSTLDCNCQSLESRRSAIFPPNLLRNFFFFCMINWIILSQQHLKQCSNSQLQILSPKVQFHKQFSSSHSFMLFTSKHRTTFKD